MPCKRDQHLDIVMSLSEAAQTWAVQETVVHDLQPRISVNKIKRKSLQNKPHTEEELKEKTYEEKFGNSAGRTSLVECQTI
jgi:hypothetical protein